MLVFLSHGVRIQHINDSAYVLEPLLGHSSLGASFILSARTSTCRYQREKHLEYNRVSRNTDFFQKP